MAPSDDQPHAARIANARRDESATVIVHFDDKVLGEQRLDYEVRTRHLAEQTARLQGLFPEARFLAANPTGCSVAVRCKEQMLTQIVAELAHDPLVRDVIRDGPMIRLAGSQQRPESEKPPSR